MKTLELEDDVYDTLMELSKELQLQPNDGNAFPYFWEPGSEKLEMNPNDEGEETFIYYDCDSMSVKRFTEHHSGIWIDYLKYTHEQQEEEPWDEETGYRDYTDYDERDFLGYLEDSMNGEVRIYTQDWVHTTEHNPSLFKEDVKDFIEGNKHHLGRNPHTYCRTSFRMGRMEKLIKILYGLNKQPKEEVNEEAKRFVYPRED